MANVIITRIRAAFGAVRRFYAQPVCKDCQDAGCDICDYDRDVSGYGTGR